MVAKSEGLLRCTKDSLLIDARIEFEKLLDSGLEVEFASAWLERFNWLLMEGSPDDLQNRP